MTKEETKADLTIAFTKQDDAQEAFRKETSTSLLNELIEEVENLHKDHGKCPLPLTCIGYENAKEDITHILKSKLNK